MSMAPPPKTPHRAAAGEGGADDWLAGVAVAAAKASHAPAELLGQYLPMLADAAAYGRRPAPAELVAVRDLGRLAAEQGVSAGRAVDLYLSAAWRLWRQLPAAVRSRDREEVRAAAEAVLRVIDDAAAALVEGHQSARRDLIRYEEALRHEFINDLLRGDTDVARMVERAEPFGLNLSKLHHVALARPTPADAQIDRAASAVERAVVNRYGDRDVLVATKDGHIVVLVAGSPPYAAKTAVTDISRVIHTELARFTPGTSWQVATGRAFAGAYGIARSYEEARESLMLAEQLHLDGHIIDARDVLVYRVLGRDQAAIIDLIREVLQPLSSVRGGPEVLLETLHAYFKAGHVATEAAQRLNVSVRTVTYRLTKVKDLTGYSPTDPDQQFTLHAAVLGARLLQWPRRPLPEA